MEILLPTFLLIVSLSCFIGTVWAYEAIFSFGDSHTDTGNRLFYEPLTPSCGYFPYGETFFHHPTGRYSNGRLMVDFFAEAFGLPYLPPYLGLVDGKKYRQGVNFAVSGATALGSEFFYDQGLGHVVHTNYSLSAQVDWFKKIKSSLCTTKQDCDSYFQKVIFLMGAIGGVDYNSMFACGYTIKQARAMIPLVIDKISEATTILIEEGAVELVIPGNFPIGCSTRYLTLFQNSDEADYDQANGCLKPYNAFAIYYNAKLKNALEKLKRKYPHTRIIYADYYNAAWPLYNAPKDLGFISALRACCGIGGGYNYNTSEICGNPGVRCTLCKDPSTYVNWDGIHFTEAAYQYIFRGLINGPCASPPILPPSSIQRLISRE